MTNDNLESSFSQTRQDLSNLKQTAVDAARDLGSTATVHAQKAQSNLKALASHAQSEGGNQLGQVQATLNEFGETIRDYVTARPFVTIGAVLAVGFLLGLSRRRRARND